MMPTNPGPVSMMAHARDGNPGRHRQMHMALSTRRWTRADLDQMPDDGNRYEIIDGELFVSPAPSYRHERLHVFFAERLRPYVSEHRLGIVLDGKPAVIFGENQVEPDLIVSPDVFPIPEKWEDVPA